MEILALFLAPLLLALLIDVLNLVGRWRTFVQRQQPREAELLRASHGFAVLVMAATALYAAGAAEINRFIDALRAAPSDPWHLVPAVVFAGVVLWGAVWTISGVRRSLAWAGYRDSRLLTRAGVKIALGVGVWLLFWYPPASWPREVLAWLTVARTMPESGACIVALMIWLLVTGCTKFLLVMWPRSGSAKEDVADDIAAQEFDWNA